MKIVQVTYTIDAAFAGQNQSNIQRVMADLQKLNHPGIHYHACRSSDGKTFIHTAFFNADEDQQTLNRLPAFIHFQEQLKANGFEMPPKQELLALVGASPEIFK